MAVKGLTPAKVIALLTPLLPNPLSICVYLRASAVKKHQINNLATNQIT
jgi:hypothetical protein